MPPPQKCDLDLTPKQCIFVPKYTNDQSLAKMRQQICIYHGNIVHYSLRRMDTPTEAQTDKGMQNI